MWKDLYFMKTYDSERRELYNWIQGKFDEYFSAVRKEIQSEEAGKLERQQQLYMREYNDKLKALKKRYNVK